jgi:excisionase family DNA binding protein
MQERRLWIDMSAMLTLAQVSERLGGPEATPIATVRYWIQVGKLRAYKPGRQLLVKPEDLEALVSGSAVGAAREEVRPPRRRR